MSEEIMEVSKCRVCSKPLRAEQSAERGIGAVCARRIMLAKADELAFSDIPEDRLLELITQAQGAPVTVEEVPEGHVSVAQVKAYMVDQEVKVSWMVRAIGGDKAQNPVLSEKWSPVYVGHKRYVSGECMTSEAAQELRDAYTRVSKPKKVYAEGEKPKRGRKPKQVTIDSSVTE